MARSWPSAAPASLRRGCRWARAYDSARTSVVPQDLLAALAVIASVTSKSSLHETLLGVAAMAVVVLTLMGLGPALFKLLFPGPGKAPVAATRDRPQDIPRARCWSSWCGGSPSSCLA